MKNFLDAEQPEYNVNSSEIRNETDEIRSAIDTEFVDFNDAQ